MKSNVYVQSEYNKILYKINKKLYNYNIKIEV